LKGGFFGCKKPDYKLTAPSSTHTNNRAEAMG